VSVEKLRENEYATFSNFLNISSWKIHELILSASGITKKKNSSGVFDLVFFLSGVERNLLKINKKS